MKLYKNLLPLFSFYFFVSLFIAGCMTGQSDFQPTAKSHLALFKWYDSLEEVRKVCGNKKAGGCTMRNGSLYIVHSIKTKACGIHEFMHVVKGDFHANMEASCKVTD